MTYPQNFSREIEIFQNWIKETMEKPGIESEEDAYAAFRAVLQTLRDRLPNEEAAHLSAQLPLILRGIYYEGYKPQDLPIKMSEQEFADNVRERLHGKCSQVDPLLLTENIFTMIQSHIDAGEVRHIQDMLPTELEKLWPTRLAA
jgi:uncharacterized protein (DUF2267 family)